MRSIRRVTGNSGVTLLELLVAIGISVITLATALAVLEVVSRQQPRITQHGLRVQQARTALERMTRDLRATYAVNASSSSAVDVLTLVRPVGLGLQPRRVRFDCSGGVCGRQEGVADPDGQLGAAQTLITGVANTDIFAYQPNNVDPRYARIKFRFDVKANSTDPAGPVTLSDGVQFRNTSTSG